MTIPLVEFDNVSYSHPVPGNIPIPALKNVHLCIEDGEFIAIVGANGSGKTTLARHINALLLPDEGTVRVQGLDSRIRANLAQIRTTVGMVFQSPEDQLVATVLEEDIAFGPENLGLPPVEIRRRVEEALATTGLTEQRSRPPHMLSAGQMQRAALAGVLAMRPRCVIFDETTAMLDPGGRRMVRNLIARLHAEGLTVIVISHFMREAVAADRIIALDHGRIAFDGPPRQLFTHPAELQRLGLDLPQAGRLVNILRPWLPQLPQLLLTSKDLLAALPPYPEGKGPSIEQPVVPALAQGPFLIEVDHLDHVYLQDTPLASQALKDVSMHGSAGQVQGLIGATGSGKSTLLQHLNGLLLPQAGRVQIGPFNLNDPQTDLRSVRRYAGLVFQNPEYQLFEQYVGDEIAYAPRLKGQTTGLRQIVQDAMQAVGLDFETFKDRLTFTLSGGERRKVAMASILTMQPELLLLDEPTAGLDPASRQDTLHSLQRLNARGTTLVLSSHHMEDIAELSQAITVLSKGQSILEGPAAQVFNQVGTLESVGLEAPLVVETAAVLRAKGWPLSERITHSADLVNALRPLVEAHP